MSKLRTARICQFDKELLRHKFLKFLKDNGLSKRQFSKQFHVNVTVIDNFLKNDDWNPTIQSVRSLFDPLGYRLVMLTYIDQEEEDKGDEE